MAAVTAMDMESIDNDVLQQAARDGTTDHARWPLMVPMIVSRINRIALHDFPIPVVPPPPSPPHRFSPILQLDADVQLVGYAAHPVQTSLFGRSSPGAGNTTKSVGPSSTAGEPPSPVSARSPCFGTLPQLIPPETRELPLQIATYLEEITCTLEDSFKSYPPHTIQRLAELVLQPRQHYRSLAGYLHALDRVVHVTSGAQKYPLPPAIPDMSAMNRLVNGIHQDGAVNSSAAAATIGSDEALGGALLTPIPWLTRRANSSDEGSDVGGGDSSPLSAGPSPSQLQAQSSSSSNSHRPLEAQVRTESTETIEGPNGMGSIETVSVSVNGIPSTGAGAALLNGGRAVTQGELLRQEQRAGLVPLNQLTRQQIQQQQAQQQQLQQQQQQQRQQQQLQLAQNNSRDANMDSESLDDSYTDQAMPMCEDDPELFGPPHARGPEEIGAADMGPQNETTSTIGVSGSILSLRSIDVEAAVGRRREAAVSSSPKRELETEDEMETGYRKRLKSEEAETDRVGDDIVVDMRQENAEHAGTRDADGDIVVPDQEDAAGAATSAEGVKNQSQDMEHGDAIKTTKLASNSESDETLKKGYLTASSGSKTEEAKHKDENVEAGFKPEDHTDDAPAEQHKPDDNTENSAVKGTTTSQDA